MDVDTVELTDNVTTDDKLFGDIKKKHDSKTYIESTSDTTDILYSVDDVPPLQLTILLGFQQYLTAFGGLVGAPLLLRKVYCIDGDDEGLAHVIGTVLVASGISTILQAVFGVRFAIGFDTPVLRRNVLCWLWRCP
ncbi:hypothetical protein FSP39_011727 [Pinctada imbricata]|uniref:Uncharacterized protein n=1 Tax=Pinctada imbricata TaxID=66713 RepID=A0AA88XNC7_PINIB|nr:hypothetical protein FSP39_011727 [Pinctada imbricata]